MRGTALIAAFSIVASTAYAERIRDLSLSPEESMRVQSAEQPTRYFEQQSDDIYTPGSTRGAQSNSSGVAMQPPTSGAPRSGYFMDLYCEEWPEPLVHNHRLSGLANCIKEVRQQACKRFAALPEETKYYADNSVKCAYDATQAEIDVAVELTCRDAMAQQIRLIKKYWSKPDITYSMLFLPDMVTRGDSFCQDGAR